MERETDTGSSLADASNGKRDVNACSTNTAQDDENRDEVKSTLPLHHGLEAGLRFGAWGMGRSESG